MFGTVSVIIPARNCEKTLERAIVSALNQTILPLEIIVIDDQSTDKTREIALSFGPLVRVIKGQAMGAGPARNLGIAESLGEFIAFLDADDEWYPKKLERQMPLAMSGAIVGTYARYVVGDRRITVGTSIRTKTDSHAQNYFLQGKGLPALLSTWVIAKEDFSKFGVFDPEYIVSQDYELAIRLVKKGLQLRIVREPLVDYLLHEDSESATLYTQQWLTGVYIKLKASGDISLEIQDWLEQAMQNRKLMRQARAGRYFRFGLISLKSRRRLLTSVLSLLASFLLHPSRFLHKALTQSDFFNLRKNCK